jgi:hypothetical protein
MRGTMKKRKERTEKITKLLLITGMLFALLFINAGGEQMTASAATTGQINALAKAKTYLKVMPFSKKGLIKQLKFDQFTSREAKYGVKHCKANWNKQAVRAAKNYLNTMSFSKKELITQLRFDGYTKSQARYGVKKVY